MNWKDFFTLTVTQIHRSGPSKFYERRLVVPDNFSLSDLVIHRFDHLKLTQHEKKKLSLGLRKIILSHEQFTGSQFQTMVNEFRVRIEKCKDKKLIFSTQGGGIYLFLMLMQGPAIKNKKIICHTSELPLPILRPKHPWVTFIYSPKGTSYLSDISTLWEDSELMSLFELKDFKASA